MSKSYEQVRAAVERDAGRGIRGVARLGAALMRALASFTLDLAGPGFVIYPPFAMADVATGSHFLRDPLVMTLRLGCASREPSSSATSRLQ